MLSRAITKTTKRITLFLAAVIMASSSFYAPALAQVDEDPSLYYLTDNGVIFYENGLVHCSEGSTVSGGAVGALQRQKGLDPKWVPVIVSAASLAGADPLAMASLLFWESRGFPKFGDPGGGSDTVGRGPWQIIRASWPASAGDYHTGVIDPEISTKVAADLVKSLGGKAGIPIGSIDQDFSKGSNIPSMATVAKSYNAGRYTWREPGIAGFNASNRVWRDARGPWFAEKQQIIDDYIIAMTYAYYLMATGESLPTENELNISGFIAEALKNTEKIKDFRVTDGSNEAMPGDCANIGSGNGDIVATARALAWPNRKYAGNTSKSVARESYQKTMPQVHGGDPGNDAWTDCGVFVSTVIRHSGADPKYQLRSTGVQLAYIERNGNPSDPNRKFDVYKNFNKISELKEGDIFVVSSGGSGHTYIHTGKYQGDDGKEYDAASASWHSRVPMAGNTYFSESYGRYTVARVRQPANLTPEGGQ